MPCGACVVSCGGGTTNCSGVCRDTETDRANCGGCGRACAAGQVCSAGACTVSCGSGTTNCDGVCRDLSNNGIRFHYQAAAAPGPAMVAYRNALRDKGWQVTTIVTSEGGTGGGATYTGTNGDAYTVVDGGGFEQQTFIDICLWPKRPEEPNCTRAKR